MHLALVWWVGLVRWVAEHAGAFDAADVNIIEALLVAFRYFGIGIQRYIY